MKSADESASITQTDIVNGSTIFADDAFNPDDMDGEDDYGINFMGDKVNA